MSVGDRTCSRTGLRLIPGRGELSFHIGKRSYPIISAPERTPDLNRSEWNRFDVLGRTFYVAETRQCAYAELLAFFKRVNGAVDSLAVDAAFHEISLEEYIEEISKEWSERDFEGLGAIPASWRFDRSLGVITLPTTGWWIDIEHPDSIAAIERAMGSFLGSQGVRSLTTSVLRSDNRFVTTMIAELLRSRQLDDDSFARGIHFGSKHGAAWCRAVWLDRTDGHDLTAAAPQAILVTDPDLTTVADRMRIRLF